MRHAATHASAQEPGGASQSKGRHNAVANNFALVLRVAAGERGLRAPCSRATCAAPNAAPTSTSPCTRRSRRLSASVCCRLLFQASLSCPSTRLCCGSTALHTHARTYARHNTHTFANMGALGQGRNLRVGEERPGENQRMYVSARRLPKEPSHPVSCRPPVHTTNRPLSLILAYRAHRIPRPLSSMAIKHGHWRPTPR